VLWGIERWLATPAGRVLRVAVGLLFIAFGLSTRNSWASAIAWVVVGLVPLVAGLFDLCFLTALTGGPLRGEELREESRNRT
jgi:hypothetical protein